MDGLPRCVAMRSPVRRRGGATAGFYSGFVEVDRVGLLRPGVVRGIVGHPRLVRNLLRSLAHHHAVIRVSRHAPLVTIGSTAQEVSEGLVVVHAPQPLLGQRDPARVAARRCRRRRTLDSMWSIDLAPGERPGGTAQLTARGPRRCATTQPVGDITYRARVSPLADGARTSIAADGTIVTVRPVHPRARHKLMGVPLLVDGLDPCCLLLRPHRAAATGRPSRRRQVVRSSSCRSAAVYLVSRRCRVSGCSRASRAGSVLSARSAAFTFAASG